MKKKVLIIFVVTLLLLSMLFVLFLTKKNNMYSSLVYIESLTEDEIKSGSGFVYKNSNGKNYIITASHVIGDSTDIKVYNQKKERTSAKVVLNDEYNDILALEISDVLDLKSAKLGNSDELKVNDKVYVIGSPYSIQNFGTKKEGKVINLDTLADIFDFKAIQISVPVEYGSSGSPVLNEKGEVIGIVFLKSENIDNSSFIIPINYIIKFIEI